MALGSLKSRIVLVFVGLTVLVMALILALVTRYSARIVSTELTRELSAGTHVYELLVAHSQRQLEMAAGVLSADFAFREAIATQDRSTMLSVISNHGLRIGAQVMMVISPDGKVIADTQAHAAALRAFPFPDLLSFAEAGGKSTGFRTMSDGRLYQLVLVPILAPKLIAWAAIGFLVDDQWARDLSAMTGLEVSVIRRDARGVTTLASSLDGVRRDELARHAPPPPGERAQPVRIGGENFQSVTLPLGASTAVVLQRSIQQAEQPFTSLRRALLWIVLAGVVLFVLGSLLLAQRIVRPLRLLGAAASRIEAGQYAERVPHLPADEIGQLAASFDRMREQVASREQRILKLAYEDPLTALPNRTRLIEAHAKLPREAAGAVMVLNLDRFSSINHALGHAIGDRLLAEIAARLAELQSDARLVARLWGDEFAFLLQGVDAAAARRFAMMVLALLRDPVTLDGQRLDIAGSIGIALYPADGSDATTLLRRAEVAMSAAKRQHLGFAFAADVGEEPLHEQLSLIGEMRDAMAREEFVLYYQPKLDLASGRITGAEALIRWRHPTRGLVPPARFIPFAEHTGFIREITPWLLQRVAQQAAAWRRATLAIVPSVNLSTLDLLNRELVDELRGLAESATLPPNGLCLEITESALMKDPELAAKHLSELAALGFRLSIDDYGVGQASLAYVRTLPVHELKIDRTFVHAVQSSSTNAAIVSSTIVLGHALGLSVVAEGAETADELDWLAANDCDAAQGYHIARPMPADELPAWIARRGGGTLHAPDSGRGLIH
jgi:diguanylate cyclase (GGDEF)-like protein